MKYSLFFLVQGNVGLSHFELRQNIADKFNLTGAVKEEPPSHITLKYDFEANDKQIHLLEKALYHFCANETSVTDDSYLKVGNVSHFNKETIFVETFPSKRVSTILESLFKLLKSFSWITWHQVNGKPVEAENLEMHLTLATGDEAIKTNFDEIYNFAKEKVVTQNVLHDSDTEHVTTRKNNDSETLFTRYTFDHIALCPLVGSLRQVQRVFYFGQNQEARFHKPKFTVGFLHSKAIGELSDSGHTRIPDVESEEVIDPLRLEHCQPDMKAFSSKHVDRAIKIATARQVSGLEQWNTKFKDIMNIIVQNNKNAYIYGGYLRDLFTSGQLAEDIDVLFTCEVEQLTDVCKVHGWPYKLKTDEKTGKTRVDYIAIGDNDAKTKFSGHPLGSGCEGEFTMNQLLYDMRRKVIIDPSGSGLIDAENMLLRIPFPPDQWPLWHQEDRLVGMRLWRFINFRARGYVAASEETTQFIMNTARQLLESDDAETKRAVKTGLVVFFKRKVCVSNQQLYERKERKFRRYFIKDFNFVYSKDEYYKYIDLASSTDESFTFFDNDNANGDVFDLMKTKGAEFYLKHVEPIHQQLIANRK